MHILDAERPLTAETRSVKEVRADAERRRANILWKCPIVHNRRWHRQALPIKKVQNK